MSTTKLPKKLCRVCDTVATSDMFAKNRAICLVCFKKQQNELMTERNKKIKIENEKKQRIFEEQQQNLSKIASITDKFEIHQQQLNKINDINDQLGKIDNITDHIVAQQDELLTIKDMVLDMNKKLDHLVNHCSNTNIMQLNDGTSNTDNKLKTKNIRANKRNT